MKKTVSLILSVVLLATLIPFTSIGVFADARGSCGALANWTFDETTGTLTVSGIGIVDTVGWGDYRDQIKTVIVEKGITKITAIGAFANCDNLTSVSLPEGLTDIGSFYGGDTGCFQGSDALSTVVLPNSLERLGPNTFNKCLGLTEITLPENLKTIENRAFYDCHYLETINLNSKAIESADYVFMGAAKKAQSCTVNVGTNVTVIPKGIFRSSGITAINFTGNKLKSIEERAFEWCDRLTALHIPEGVTSVGIGIISHCDGMKELTVPSTLTDITVYAFGYAYGLEKIYYNATNAKINGNSLLSGNSVFGYTGLHSNCTLYVGENVTALPDNIFYDSKISSVVFNGVKVTKIGKCAFHGANALKSVVYYGTQEMWDSIKKSTCNNEQCTKYLDSTLFCVGSIDEPIVTYLKGDVNMNGKLDARDYLLLKRAYFGTFTLECPQEAADINNNGKIEARDYLLLKRAYFGTYTIE